MCLEAKHVGTHLMGQLKICNLKAEKNKLNHSGCLLSQILFHCFVCICICIFFLFYYPTLSLLCMFQSYNNNIFCGWFKLFLCGWTSSWCLFTDHIYSAFCNQKQGSTKNVHANPSDNLNGTTFFSSLASLARHLRH